jgi:hypothetical protein
MKVCTTRHLCRSRGPGDRLEYERTLTAAGPPVVDGLEDGVTDTN